MIIVVLLFFIINNIIIIIIVVVIVPAQKLGSPRQATLSEHGEIFFKSYFAPTALLILMALMMYQP